MLSYLRFKASLNGQRWSFLRVCPDWNQHLEKILASQVFALTRNSCMRVPRMCQVMFNCSQSCKRKASIEVYHPSGTFCLIPYKRSAFFTSQCAETSYGASARLRRRVKGIHKRRRLLRLFYHLCKLLRRTMTHDCLEDPCKTFAAFSNTTARFEPHKIVPT